MPPVPHLTNTRHHLLPFQYQYRSVAHRIAKLLRWLHESSSATSALLGSFQRDGAMSRATQSSIRRA